MSDGEYTSDSEVEERAVRMARPAASEERKSGPLSRGPLSKYWCWTSFADAQPKTGDAITYQCFQRETAPDTGRLHWQGYSEFTHKVRRNQVQLSIGDGSAHCELRKGTAQEARDYCRKLDSAVAGTGSEYGTLSKPVSNDFTAVQEAIKAGSDLPELADKYFGTFLRYNRGLREVLSMRDARTRATFSPVRVLCVYGSTGCGKSRFAHKLCDDQFDGLSYRKHYSRGEASWWDGYMDQRCIIIDDFEGDGPIGEILQLTDGYGHNKSWPVKGGFTRIHPSTIIFTSNNHPAEWYKDRENDRKIQALLRRFTEIITCAEGHELHYVKVERMDL